ncbi:Transducin family protein/WD-40 repeat protein [Quillaja saponaria]|uniref:Transducin family protein/WD-40 repeat protein n=1 Tax=Quillaja saponaria TaxID=32244 RepID=A0AAD7PDW9_QUISA|nr:Transducin family protein/WD-40 repeat protein [Quillaja saponaria]
MTEASSSSQSPVPTIDPIDHLPLQLLRSDIIPPAPTRSKSTIDWLPNFSGYSWVAYGASSLLVISHFPSPLSSEETLIGPIFRQVFELSSDQSSAVAAVSWSPESPSFGELAAVAENCIWVFSHDSSSSKGSFCWSQNAVLVQSTKVEEIRWTGSADGIVSCGIEVVLWKKRGKFWEIAWKFKADQPQTLVSATWSIEGPSATATCPSKERIQGSAFNELSKGVLVCQSDGKCEYSKAELCHPLPVSMIQWRPLRGRLSNRDVKHSVRHILLTCCLDGTVRLWSEIDNVKTRKICKDNYDQNSIKRSFCVSAVIEINQALNGTLGSNIVVTWGTEIGGIFKNDGGGQQYFSKEGFEHDMAGKCDWVIGFGPGMLVNFWAIHCLDDIFPLRFPRVTLWRRHELQGLETGYLNEIKSSNFEDRILLNKIILSRNCFSSPPIMCSPIHLLPSNSLVFSSFNVQTSYDTVVNALDKSTTENFLSHSAGSCLSLDGHAGRILQVSIHPYITEVELAASLDSNGLIIFWSLSTISNCILGCPALIPTWELFGKLVTHDSCSKYTSLRWAPSVLKEELVLLMGHARGIDCFIVKICKNEEENIECHYLCTIPFSGHGPYEDGPNNIFTIPLFSTCDETFHDNKFMLLGVWMTGFQALSWEIILHSFDLSESCCACNFDVNNLSEGSMWMFESTFSGKRYFVAINPSSSQLADPYSEDVVTSFSVVCPHSLIRTQQEFTSGTDFCRIYPACILATGCSDGSLKLWKNHPGKPSTIHLPWELVGVIFAHEGPIDAICLSDCGRKIATICNRSHSNTVSTIHIWDSVNLMGAGTFLLEDTLTLDRDVITLNWLTLGTGRLLLGVCMQNELQVYAEKCCGGLTMSSSVNFLETNVWVCVAFARTFSPIYNFFWGPRATSVVVHGSYFSIFSHSLFHANENKQANCFPCNLKENLCDSKGGINESVLSAIFTDSDIGDFKELLIEDSCGYMKSFQPIKINMKENYLSSSLFLASAQLKSEFATKLGFFSILEVVERLTGSLPIYQPEALLMNISSGNWKRAYVALNHLVECLTSDCSPEKRYILPNYGLPEILLSNYLEGLLSNSSNDKGLQWSGDATLITSSSESQRGSFQFSYDSGSASANDMFTSQSTRSELRRFIESLEKLPESAAITNIEKTQILAIIDLLSEVSSLQSSSPYQSLDDPGRRFWVTVRFQQLLFLRKFGRVASVEELRVDSRLIVWAYHSDCQENLFSSIIANEPSWQELRSLGIGFWFTNVPQLRTRIEKLARLQYLKNKNPKDCALLYVALNRLQVLAGLFKISKDEKDKPLVGFLSRNFQDGKNKAAALKNAYVLLGKHQLELAIAFFLLGGDYSSAINICIKNLGDEQLALVICRLVEGRGGQLERHLITKYLHPSSTEKRNYWLASLLEWELGNYYQSYLSMINFSMNPVVEKSALMSNSVPFLDPNIGFYCQMLANKNSLKNAVGEQEAAILARWATLMRANCPKQMWPSY